MKKLLLLLLAVFPLTLHAQIHITPYVASGYINHLGRNGINSELGIDAELCRRLDLAVNYRYTKATRDFGNDVKISGISSNISYILINRNNHRFMIGTGLTYGRYIRYLEYLGLEHDNKNVWFDPVKLRYDYTLPDGLRVGAIVSVTGENGDGSTFFGVLLGYKF